MIYLTIGLLLWVFLKLMKRLAPTVHNSLYARAGGKGMMVMAVLMLLSIILMIIGYHSAPNIPLYTPHPSLQHLAMSLDVVAVILLGVGHSRSRLKAHIRHPMLLSVVLWAFGHLLVRGDWASVILFGGLLFWAIGEMLIINKQDGAWQRPSTENLSIKGDMRLMAIGILVSLVIIAIHIWGFGLIL